MAYSEQYGSDIKSEFSIITSTAGSLNEQEDLFQNSGVNSVRENTVSTFSLDSDCPKIEMDTTYDDHKPIKTEIAPLCSVQSDHPKIEIDTAYEVVKTECEVDGEVTPQEDVIVTTGNDFDIYSVYKIEIKISLSLFIMCLIVSDLHWFWFLVL